MKNDASFRPLKTEKQGYSSCGIHIKQKMERKKSVSTWQAQIDMWGGKRLDSSPQRERLRRSSTTTDVQRKSVRSSMSSQPSSRRATTRASKKIGISEELTVGVDGDGGGGSAAGVSVGLGFKVGTSGVAGEMIGNIYRSLKALQKEVS